MKNYYAVYYIIVTPKYTTMNCCRIFAKDKTHAYQKVKSKLNENSHIIKVQQIY